MIETKILEPFPKSLELTTLWACPAAYILTSFLGVSRIFWRYATFIKFLSKDSIVSYDLMNTKPQGDGILINSDLNSTYL